MKIAVTGYKGNLGKVLVQQHGCEPFAVKDITDVAEVKAWIGDTQPDVIIHCAAYTDVDKAEGADMNKCIATNIRGTATIRDHFSGYFVCLSTDYIFDGTNGPYQEHARGNPLSIYGLSKYAAENIVMSQVRYPFTIVRTSGIFGNYSGNVVTKLLDNFHQYAEFGVPDNLIGSYVYVTDLANAILAMVSMVKVPKILHLVNEGIMSRYTLAKQVASVFHQDSEKVYPIEYKKLDGVADRPKRAGLIVDKARKLGIEMPTVIDSLIRMANDA